MHPDISVSSCGMCALHMAGTCCWSSKSIRDWAATQVDVHTNLGDLWRAQGPSGQAEAQRCYAEALRVDVRHAPAWRGLGDLMRERGEHTPAVACYQAGSKTECSVYVHKPGRLLLFCQLCWSMLASMQEICSAMWANLNRVCLWPDLLVVSFAWQT